MRFVVLHHTGVEPPHFDLMFETAPGSKLVTWRSPVWPLIGPTAVERLADHRRAYLEYEGAVSGGRGEVKRVLAGSFRFSHFTTERWELLTDDGLRFALVQSNQGGWVADVGQTA
ncbi:MAG TPA: hypothetical protein VH475_14100 [Tepidisphaeraceae bacterium]|jgi:hypothetical protein